MSKLIQTAPCRFCGQMVQIDEAEEGDYTKEQAEEMATSLCDCSTAQEYQKEKKRKKKAMKNVSKLFGEDAEPDKRCRA